ncbi:MAG: glycosyltransferase family 2 protein [Ruminococcus sp.]|nr:glycosyltransferase family 2 protein [Ruminococcus sp.]
MDRPKIAVLMSTYNGEKYIREQIDSILAQKDVDVTLYIRDDGSSDETRNIILEYVRQNGNIHLYFDGRNLRPGASFLKLLCFAAKYKGPFDYYAFSDQDDIWLEEKLIRGIRSIEDIDGPALYCSNQRIYKNGEELGLRFDEPPEITLLSNLSSNKMYGCTMVFNNELAQLVRKVRKPGKDYLYIRNHDAWTILLAFAVGKVVYDHDSYILYRIHDNNVVGIREVSFCERAVRFMHKTVKNLRSNSARYVLRALGDADFADRDYVELMAYYRNDLKTRLKLIKNADRFKTEKESRFVFIVKVLLVYI